MPVDKSNDLGQEPAPDADRHQSLEASRRIGWLQGLSAGAVMLVIITALVTPLGSKLWDLLLPTDNNAPQQSPTTSAATPFPSLSANGDEEPPFTVAVADRTDPCYSGWIVDPSVNVPADLFFDDDWRAWAAENGAVAAGTSVVEFTIQGRSDAEVVLLDARVRVLEKEAPRAGIHYHQGCGNPLPVRYFDADLDANPPTVTPRLTEGFGVDTPISFPYAVNISEAEVFFLYANTKSCDCTWTIELDWTSQGRRETFMIDNNGEPFRTSSVSGAQRSCMKTQMTEVIDPITDCQDQLS